MCWRHRGIARACGGAGTSIISGRRNSNSQRSWLSCNDMLPEDLVLGCRKSSHRLAGRSFLCDSLALIEVVACITLGLLCKVAVAMPRTQLEGCTLERCQRERERESFPQMCFLNNTHRVLATDTCLSSVGSAVFSVSRNCATDHGGFA